MPTSSAIVATDAAARYAKQLLSHLGHKASAEQVPGEPDSGRLVFAYGTGTLHAEPDRLVLEASAPDDESLAHVEDVLSRHLERFGSRAGLSVRWQRSEADAG